jgi:general stress protein YciG
MNEQPKLRGFAAMSPDRRREIARLGGRSIPAEKRYYARNREAAAKAGQKGGKAIPKVNDNDRKFLAEVIGEGLPWDTLEGMNRASRNRAARLIDLGLARYEPHRDWIVPVAAEQAAQAS